MKDRTPDIIYEFNLLYSMNYFPSITFDEINWKREVPVSDAVNFYIDYFRGVSREPEAVLKAKIEKYLIKISVNGMVIEKNTGRIGTMFWKVDLKETGDKFFTRLQS